MIVLFNKGEVMELNKENWILKRIYESINKNGCLNEIDLRILRTQFRYRDEFLELLDKFKNDPYVVAYLYMKDHNQESEMFPIFKEHHRVKAYLHIVNLIKIVDEVERELKCHEWCPHIILKDDENYRCVRCGVYFNNDPYCNNYTLLSNVIIKKEVNTMRL